MAGGAWFNGGAITDADFSLPAQNFLTTEFASWHYNRKTTLNNYPVDVGKMNLNAVFVDGHAKVIKGKQFRINSPLRNMGWDFPEPHGADLDWFLTSDDNLSCPRCNSSSPGGDAKDID